MRLGGPVFVDTKDPVEYIKVHRKLGYRAAYCPKDLTINDTEKIVSLREASSKEDVVLAEVGAWCNTMDPRPDIAKINIRYVTEKLALADELGAICCVNIIGTSSTENWYAPHSDNFSEDFFQRAVEVSRKIIDDVKPKRSKLTFEIMPFSFLDCYEDYLRLITAIDRKETGVHLDIVNCINSPRKYYNNSQLIKDCFKYLAPYIVSCHAKDILLRPEPVSVQFDEVRLGLGIMDYKTLLSNLNHLPGDVPIMLEHLPNENEYDLAREYILKVAESIGLHF